MRIALIGYAPDVDPMTPGVMVECNGFVSSQRGMEGAPSAVSAGLPALAAECFGLATFRKLDNTSITVAGTATKLYKSATTSWTDLSGAATFAASSAARWSFAQYGNVTLASNKNNFIQAATTGNFAVVSGSAPKAAYIEAVNQFVFAANIDDGTDKPNGWACSALGDYTDWNASIATQSVNGLLTDTPGPITGLRRLNDNIVVYKRRGIYVGTYIGPEIVWSFQLSSADVGAIASNAIASVEYAHYFMGEDDFYFFDGSRPVAFGAPVKETVFVELDKAVPHLCTTVLDWKNSRIYFYYPGNANVGFANRCVVYNYRTQRWGRDDRVIEAAGQFVSAGITYGDLGTYYSTYANLPSSAYGLAFLSASTESPAIVNSSHVVQSLTGSAATTSFRLGDIGSNQDYTTVTRVQPRFLVEPSSATITNYYKYAAGESYVEDQTTAMQSCRFDFLRSARWHSGVLTFSGPAELADLDVTATHSGVE
jgi:hypothetical protein